MITTTQMRGLTLYCVGFINQHEIECPEDVHQTDRIVVELSEFVEGICNILGYVSFDNNDRVINVSTELE